MAITRGNIQISKIIVDFNMHRIQIEGYEEVIEDGEVIARIPRLGLSKGIPGSQFLGTDLDDFLPESDGGINLRNRLITRAKALLIAWEKRAKEPVSAVVENVEASPAQLIDHEGPFPNVVGD